MCQKCPPMGKVGKAVKVAKVQQRVTKPTYYFPSHSLAWAFMKWCDAKGVSAGYPSTEETEAGYGVMVLDSSTADLGLLFRESPEGKAALKDHQDRRLVAGLAKLAQSFGL